MPPCRAGKVETDRKKPRKIGGSFLDFDRLFWVKLQKLVPKSTGAWVIAGKASVVITDKFKEAICGCFGFFKLHRDRDWNRRLVGVIGQGSPFAGFNKGFHEQLRSLPIKKQVIPSKKQRTSSMAQQDQVEAEISNSRLIFQWTIKQILREVML